MILPLRPPISKFPIDTFRPDLPLGPHLRPGFHQSSDIDHLPHLPAKRQDVPPPSSSESTPSAALASATASTKLSWWQLLCISLGGVLTLCIGGWLWWRHRKKAQEDTRRGAEIQMEEIRRRKAGTVAEGQEGQVEEETGSESYDSVSDGGTIRPKKRQRGRGRRDRRARPERGRKRRPGRGRSESESESETETETETDTNSDSEWSAATYYPRGRGKRDRRGTTGRRGDRRNDRGREPARRRPSPPPSPSPSPPPRRPPPKKFFRDSVFSSYGSMKQAAVKLKQVEAKVRLKKQLEEEEELERKRRDKVRSANERIAREVRRERERERERERGRERDRRGDHSGGSQRPLIPAVRSSSGSSALPTPRPRGASGSRQPTYPPPAQYRQGSSDSTRPLRRPSNDAQHGGYVFQKAPVKISAASRQISRPVPNREPFRPALAARRASGSKVGPLQQRQQSKRSQGKQSQDRLHDPSRDTLFSRPESAHETVYVPVSHPKDRPTIPKGGLAPAPPGKMKSSPPVSTPALESGSGAGRWADRLRQRR